MKLIHTATLTFALVLPSLLLSPSSAHAQSWACRNLGIGCPQSIPGTSSTPEPAPNFVFAQSANLTLPNTGQQNDDWSCGPNSAARVLSYYGFDASYNDLRRTVQKLGSFPGSNLLGTAPHELRNAMSRWAGSEVQLKRQASFEQLRSLLSEGKPVITLVRVGTIEKNQVSVGSLTIGIGGTWPAMHWFVVNGFDENRQMIYYTDTDEKRYEMPYDEFLSKWGWGIGRGAASSTLAANGVETRTMIWVDRVAGGTNASNPQPTPVPQLASSDLLWYQHQGLSNGSTDWASGTGTKVGNGWNYKTVFASSNGVIYGITANNELCWYRHDGWQNGSNHWANGNCTVVGHGWNFKTVFASAGGAIYGIKENGELCWYRHDGWQDGSNRWANGNCTVVGHGWDFKTVFASASGVIYGIKENGELYWYRHDGWQDGSNRWANGGTGINVGSGWNFKTVFASSNGINSVIYAIKENGELYWYRHDGWQDGSNHWANGGTGIVVGHGWNFRSVFASSNGIIYGIVQ